MRATAVGTKRIHAGHLRIAGLALALVLVGATIATLAISNRSDRGSEARPLPVVNDLSTLALDQNGADLFTLPTTRAPNITGLALDRDGADVFAEITAPVDVTSLHLDRDGADLP